MQHFVSAISIFLHRKSAIILFAQEITLTLVKGSILLTKFSAVYTLSRSTQFKSMENSLIFFYRAPRNPNTVSAMV